MKVLRYFVDLWARFSSWYALRRDTIERLEARIDHLQRTHRLELLERDEMLAIKDRTILLMAMAHERNRSIIAADMAVNARVAADAVERPRGN